MSNRQASIPLQSKVSLTLVLLIAAFVMVSYTILRSVIAPALRNDIENIEAITADWGPWDDMYSYVTGTNPGFEKSNLNRPTLANLDPDLLVVYSAESDLLWGQFMDGGVGVPIETLQGLIPDETALAAELFDTTKDLQDRPRFEIVACSQGRDAIQAAEAARIEGAPFDVVILDIRMPPGIDGVEAGSQIHKQDPDVEIIFVTGYSDLPFTELQRRVPPPMHLHYFHKPLSFSQLAEDVVSMVRTQ